MIIDRLAEARRFRQGHVPGNYCAEQLVAVIFLDFREHLRRKVEPSVVHRYQNSRDCERRVVSFLNLLYGNHESVLNWMRGLDNVTKDNLKKVMNKYFVTDNRTIASIGK